MTLTRLSGAFLMAVVTGLAPVMAQNTAPPQQPAAAPAQPPAPAPRPTPPTRDPHTPGYVTAKELPDGTVPPPDADGNFIIGPTHNPAPEMAVQEGVPQGTVYNFTMNSADSKIYPGIAREPGTFGTPDPNDPAKLIVTTSHPAPYTRRVAVYVPKQYVPGTAAPFIVGADGPDPAAVHGARQSDRAEARAGDDRHLHRQRQRRRARQPARPGIRHDVGTLRGVRRDGSAAAGREAIQREADEGSRRPRDDGRQFRRLGGADHGVVSPGALSPRADVFGHVREPAVAAERRDAARRVGVSRAPDPEQPGRSRFASGWKSATATCSIRTSCATTCTIGSSRTRTWPKVLAAKGYHYQFVFARNAGHTRSRREAADAAGGAGMVVEGVPGGSSGRPAASHAAMPPAISLTPVEAVLLQQARGDRRAVAARAVDEQRPVGGSSRARSARWLSGMLTLPAMRFSARSRGARTSTSAAASFDRSRSAASGALSALGRRCQVGPRRRGSAARPAGSRRRDRSRCGRGGRPTSCSRPGSAMITIGRSRLSIVPAHVAYWPPRPMLMLPARCAAANSLGSRVSRICAPSRCSAST